MKLIKDESLSGTITREYPLPSVFVISSGEEPNFTIKYKKSAATDTEFRRKVSLLAFETRKNNKGTLGEETINQVRTQHRQTLVYALLHIIDSWSTNLEEQKDTAWVPIESTNDNFLSLFDASKEYQPLEEVFNHVLLDISELSAFRLSDNSKNLQSESELQ